MVLIRLGLGLALSLVLTTTGCGARVAPTASSANPGERDGGTTAAQALMALAGHKGDRVPWANHVTYSIGGTRVGSFEPGPGVPSALRSCPHGAKEVEGHRCPVSALITVAHVGSTAVIERNLPDHVGCNTFHQVPVSPAARSRVVVIRPAAEARDCASDFAVSLFLDADSKVSWLDLTLSGP